MSQTVWGSIVEAKTNIAIGFSINYVANIMLLPWLWNPDDVYVSALWLGVAFTGISLVRQFVIRRWFNTIKSKWNTEEAK